MVISKYYNIPQELKDSPHWVVAKLVPDPEKPGKFNKRPKSAKTGTEKGWNKPESLATFDEAVVFCDKNPDHILGFAFEHSPFMGVDFDNAFDSNRLPKSGVLPFLSLWGGKERYMEFSPSGNGLRLFLRKTGAADGLGERLGQQDLGDGASVELFVGAFCTVTGRKMGDGQAFAEADPKEAWRYCAASNRSKAPADGAEPMGRNHALAQYAGKLAKKFLSEGEILALVYKRNQEFADPLDESEIRQTVGQSVKKWVRDEPKEADPESWPLLFDRFEVIPELKPLIGRISNVGESNILGALPKHNKTWVMLSIVKALITGEPLWGYPQFQVHGKANRVIYLIPEAGVRSVFHRLSILGLNEYLNKTLFVRTLSMGGVVPLADPRILKAAEGVDCQGADVFLDTLIRFTEGEENSASDQRVLMSCVFALLGVSRSIWAGHHTGKEFEKSTRMTSQNILRGTGDFAAAFHNIYGLKKLNEDTNTIHIERTDSRDLDPLGPFQLQGRPYLSDTGNFKMTQTPDNCEPLSQQNESRGARPGRKPNPGRDVWGPIAQDMKRGGMSDQKISDELKKTGHDVSKSTVTAHFKKLDQGQLESIAGEGISEEGAF